MGRILAIDYGSKRVGLAVTDPGQIIATALDTIHAKDVIAYLKNYLQHEEVELFVVGEPKRADGTPSQSTPLIEAFIKKLNKTFPDIPVAREDESYTSKRAVQTLVMGGFKKKDRQKKENLDKISATLILQSFLETKRS